MNWLDTFLLSHNIDLTPLMTLQDMGNRFKSNFGPQIAQPVLTSIGIAGFVFAFVKIVMAFLGDAQKRKSNLIQGCLGVLVGAGCWLGGWGFSQTIGNGIGETVRNLFN